MPNAWAYFVAQAPYNYLRCTPIDGTTKVSVVYNTDAVTANKTHNSNTLSIPETVSDGSTTYTVKEIGYQGFRNISNITQFELPNTLTKIGYKAFAQCTNLGNNTDHESEGAITIPASVTHIGARAFFGHSSNLKHVFLESSTPPEFFNEDNTSDPLKINDVFYVHTLIKFHIPGGSLDDYKNNAQWAGGDFYDPDNIDCSYFDANGLRYKKLSDDSENVSVEVINILESTTTITIPSTVVSSKDGQTYTVTKIANEAFRNNNSVGKDVKYIKFSNSCNITSIGEGVFTLNTNLKGSAIGDDTPTDGVFIIPESVTEIGFHAFWGCNNIHKIIFKGKAPTLLKRISEGGQTGEIASNTFTHAVSATKGDPITCQFTCGNIEPDAIKPDAWDVPILHDCPSATISKSANGSPTNLPDKKQKYFGKITYTRYFTPGRWETLYLPFELEDMTVTVSYVNGGEPFSVNSPWNKEDGGYFHLAVRNGEYFDYVQNGDTLQGNTAYIIQFPSEDFADVPVTFTSKSDYNKISDFDQQGATTEHNMYGNTTLQKQTLNSPSYYLGTDNNFKYADTQTLNPFECYLTPIVETQSYVNPRMMSVRFRPQSDVTTDVPNINADQISWQRNGNTLTIQTNGQPVNIYNINGMLIQSFTEGNEQVSIDLDNGCYIINSLGYTQKIIF